VFLSLLLLLLLLLLQNIKKKYPLVLNRVNQLVDRIHGQGPSASIDVDQAALRVTLDVIGLVRTDKCATGSRIELCGW
jgi:hypothetical protein